jgi:hypothetical protein
MNLLEAIIAGKLGGGSVKPASIVTATGAMTSEQKAQTRENIGAGEPLTPQQIADGAGAWLEDNLETPSTPPIDSTLSVANAAADAKATGDKFAQIIESPVQVQFSETSKLCIALNMAVGQPVSLTPYQAGSEVWRYAVVSCEPGEKFTVKVTGGSTPRGWGFVDSSDNLLSKAEYGAVDETIKAPANAAKAIFNDNSGTGSVTKSTAPGRLDVLEDAVDAINDDVNIIKSGTALVSSDESCNRFIRELFLEGAQENTTYKWYVAARNNPTYGYNIAIAIDGTTNIVAYLRDLQTEPNNPVVIPAYNNSGITGYAVLDWSVLEDGSNKVYNVPLNDSVKSLYNSPCLYTYLKGDPGDDISISMPSQINAFVGDTLQLYYQGMFRCVNSYNYAVTLTCDVGSQFPRYYELTPTNANVGDHQLKVELRDNNGKILKSKDVIIHVSAAPINPSAKKYVFCVGASLTQNGEWVGEFVRKLQEDYNVSNVETIGRLTANGVKLEATGGYKWTSYTSTTSGALYKFYFTSATLPSSVNVGDVYAVNGHNYTITEINIPTSDGGGYISCTGTGLPGSASGTLTLVSGTGDDTLTYYNYISTGNPFAYNGAIDLTQYMSDYCDGAVPDVVYTELFVNGTLPYNADVESMLNNMKSFAQMIHAAFPNCKIALGMPSCPDEKGGTGANYHAVGGFSWGYGIKWTFMQYMNEIERYLTENGLSSYVSLVNWTNEFDSENDYQQTAKAVNVRATQTEVFGVNGVHPANIGYMQMADSAVRHFVANFCQ